MQADSLGLGNQQDLGSVLEFINKNKLTDNRPLRPPRVLTENTYILGQANGQFAASPVGWVQPSGASAHPVSLRVQSTNSRFSVPSIFA